MILANGWDQGNEDNRGIKDDFQVTDLRNGCIVIWDGGKTYHSILEITLISSKGRLGSQIFESGSQGTNQNQLKIWMFQNV